jgi:hypothetical protein
VARRLAEQDAEHHGGVLRRGNVRAARIHHPLRAPQQLPDVDAGDGRGQHAEVGEGRVTTADGRHSVTDVAEPCGGRHRLDLRSRVRDRDEAPGCLGGAEQLGHPPEEVVLEDVRLEGRT